MGEHKARDVPTIRLAILSRLAPGLRHRLMGELQSVQFSSELAVRLFDTGADPARLAASVHQIPPLARNAAAACSTLIEWLRNDERATTALEPALSDLIRLAGDDWSLRGIESSVDARSADAHVGRTALRELAVLAVLALTDTRAGPLDIAVTATPDGDHVVVDFRARPSSRAAHLPELPRTEPFGTDDVSVLAAAHGVASTCDGDGIALRLPVKTRRDASGVPGGA